MRRSPIFAALLCLAPAAAGGADFHVTRFDDPLPGACAPTDCSLREAVNAAQAADGADRVLMPAGAYVLAFDDTLDVDAGETGPLRLDSAIELVGAGRTATTLTGSSNLPFLIAVSLDAAPASVTLSDFSIVEHAPTQNVFLAPVVVDQDGTLTVRRFGMRDNASPVAAIYAAGTLRVVDSVFERNAGLDDDGGVTIYAARAPLSITGSQFIDNTTAFGVVAVTLPGGGNVDLRDNLFRGNLASEGSGGVLVRARGGLLQVDLRDSVFEENEGGGRGGAVQVEIVDNASTATRLQIVGDGARFSRNTSAGPCGAMSVEPNAAVDLLQPPTLAMDLARFDGNVAGSSGGALCTTGETTITRSTFVDNTASGFGGAVVSVDGALRVERSTLSGNAGSSGGAIFSLGTVMLDTSTLHGNTATASGGALALSGTGENLVLRSTIAGNRANGAPNALRIGWMPALPATVRFSASIVQGGCSTNDPTAFGASSYTLESPGNGCGLPTAPGTFNQRNVPAAALALGPLADNGGPTLTRMPAEDSVARDPNGLSSGPCTRIDQRGYASIDHRCDAGAVEVAGVPPPPAIFADGFE